MTLVTRAGKGAPLSAEDHDSNILTLQETAEAEFLNEYWDDLRFPASGLNPPGPENAPTVNATLGTLTFADSATRVIAGLAQMPHAWAEGTAVEPHVHWIQPAAGNVVWRLEYRLLPAVGGEVPGDWTTVTASEAVSAYPGSGNWVQITRFPAIAMTGLKISAMIIFRLARLGGDSGDTLASAVDLLEFDIHYRIDTPGSQQEFIKGPA